MQWQKNGKINRWKMNEKIKWMKNWKISMNEKNSMKKIGKIEEEMNEN